MISWYYEVYRPLAEIIREQKILKNFPHRTDADLYLWIIEHLYYLREKFREEVSLKEAAAHFAEEYAPGFFKRIFGFFREQKAISPESGDSDTQQAAQDEELAELGGFILCLMNSQPEMIGENL